MSLKDDLIAAKAVIDTPEKWGKGLTRNNPCSLEACWYVASPRERVRRDDMREALRSVIPDGYEGVADFNDSPETTHADVMSMFDRAISAAES